MSVRYFFSLPALPDVATVDAAADKLGAHRVGGYRGFDGLRACVELSENIALQLLDEASRRLERDATELERIAQEWTP